MRGNQRFGRQNYNGDGFRRKILEIKDMREVGVGQMIGNLEVITEGTIEVLVIVDQRKGLE